MMLVLKMDLSYCPVITLSMPPAIEKSAFCLHSYNNAESPSFALHTDVIHVNKEMTAKIQDGP